MALVVPPFAAYADTYTPPMAGGRIFGSAPWWWLADDTPGDRTFVRLDGVAVSEVDPRRSHVLLADKADLGGQVGRIVNLPVLMALRYTDRAWPRTRPLDAPDQVWDRDVLLYGSGAPWAPPGWIPAGALCVEPPLDPGLAELVADQLWPIAVLLAQARLLGPWEDNEWESIRRHPDGSLGVRVRAVSRDSDPLWQVDGGDTTLHPDREAACMVADQFAIRRGYSLTVLDLTDLEPCG